MEEQQKKINIALSPEMAGGKYSNLALVAHSSNEFILDFISALPGSQQPMVVSRVIMSPANAKRLLSALGENIANYERQFGPIADNQPGGVSIPFGLSNNKGDA